MSATIGDRRGLAPARHAARRRQDQRFSTRAFWWTCSLLIVLGLVSYLAQRDHATGAGSVVPELYKRDVDILKTEKTDESCRLVHKSTITDKCRFIRRHCPDEEPGFLAYLDFYYCSLGHAKPIAFTLLMIWLGTLFSTIGIAASDFFCINLSTIATTLGMSESLAGVTFLAFGNGSPDVFSTFAAMSTNSSSLAIGELIGAAGFITAVVAGSMALVRPFKVGKKSFVRDVGFFAVAAAFSMGFLADGNLHLWECIVMVCYYIFYVTVVVVWHWWSTRRARRRERKAAARGHYVVPGSEEVEVLENYHDDPDDRATTRPTISRGVSAEDFRNLEQAGAPQIETSELDEDDNARLMSQLATNMQLRRRGRARQSTITPVRPSLMGALEFQAVLSNLHKERNMHTIPLYRRRHTDDVLHTLQDDDNSVVSAPEAEAPLDATDLLATPVTPAMLLSPAGGRVRAVSTNDISHLRVDPDFLQQHARLRDIQENDNSLLSPFSPVAFQTGPNQRSTPVSGGTAATSTPSPRTAVTPVPRSPEWPAQAGQNSSLGPAPQLQAHSIQTYLQVPGSPERISVHETSPPKRPKLHGLRIPSNATGSSPNSPFPAYGDNPSSPSTRAPSIYLPPASAAGTAPPYFEDDIVDEASVEPPSWWPSLVPAPNIILCTLFPTLYPWHTKSWLQIVLGLIAAPSVFLLTVTLPVVEADPDEEQDDNEHLTDLLGGTPRLQTNGAANSRSNSHDGAVDSAPTVTTPLLPGHGTANTAAKVENLHNHNAGLSAANGVALPEAPSHPHNPPATRSWNRWLVIIQLYLAPIMVVFILYTQYIDLPKHTSLGRTITRPILIGLLVSTVLLVPLLLVSTPTHRPKALLPILSLAGFVVSIAWISTIAGQVVAVLKTFAIILNMSHAILGLTVFAVGNSLGDLVADITVARLGFPVMALSACFGGPMLNILLGIGLSGCWQLIGKAQRRVEKGHSWDSGTYKIDVGDSLIVSGVTLLLTLVGLLVAVPLNKWVMSKRIAWSLITLWCVGTILNVVLEVVGVHSKHTTHGAG